MTGGSGNQRIRVLGALERGSRAARRVIRIQPERNRPSGGRGSQHGRRQETMLDRQDSSRQRNGGIVREHGDFRLSEDRTAIVLLGDEVNRRPGHRLSSSQYRLMDQVTVHSRAPVFREERRMDVDDPAAPRLHRFVGHPFEVPGQHHQVRFRPGKDPEPLGGIGGIIQDVRRDAVLTRYAKTAGILPVTDDQHNPRRGRVPESAEERRQIAAPPRYHRRDAQEHSRQI